MKNNPIFLLLLAGISASSCVTKKVHQTTVNELSAVHKKLDSVSLETKQLRKDLELEKVLISMRNQEAAKQLKYREYTLYREAVEAFDYNTAAIQLARLVQIDTAGKAMYYDSLAFYHYFYLNDPNMVRQTNAAWFYTQKGLAINPKNAFLLEIQAKLELELQHAGNSLAILENLYAQNADYTYLYEMAYIHLVVGNNVKKADSIISAVIKKTDSEVKPVRIEYMQYKITQSVPAKAAFLYLRAIIQNSVQGNPTKAMATLKEILKISPEFVYARESYEQLKNPQRQAPPRPY